MSQLHGFLGLIALVLGLMAAGWSVGLALASKPPSRLFVRSLIVVVVGVVLAAATGGAIAIAERPPDDPLHVVYGIAALAVLPLTAVMGAGRPANQRSIVLSVAGVVLVVLLFRLVETGG